MAKNKQLQLENRMRSVFWENIIKNAPDAEYKAPHDVYEVFLKYTATRYEFTLTVEKLLAGFKYKGGVIKELPKLERELSWHVEQGRNLSAEQPAACFRAAEGFFKCSPELVNEFLNEMPQSILFESYDVVTFAATSRRHKEVMEMLSGNSTEKFQALRVAKMIGVDAYKITAIAFWLMGFCMELFNMISHMNYSLKLVEGEFWDKIRPHLEQNLRPLWKGRAEKIFDSIMAIPMEHWEHVLSFTGYHVDRNDEIANDMYRLVEKRNRAIEELSRKDRQNDLNVEKLRNVIKTQEGTIASKDSEIQKIRTALAESQARATRLQDNVTDREKVQNLESENRQLQEMVAEKQRALNELRGFLDMTMQDISGDGLEKAEPLEERVVFDDILLVGGHERLHAKLRKELPGIRILHPDVSIVPNDTFNGIRGIIFRADYCNHRVYQRVVDEARRIGINVSYSANNNVGMIREDIYALIAKMASK